MFNGKETIKRKITIAILTVVSLSFCTPVFAQQQDFNREEDNFFGNFLLNTLPNIEVVTDLGKDISLYDIPAGITVIEQVDIDQPVQKTNPEIPWTVTAIDLSDDDLHKLGSAILGLNSPQPEKPDIHEISIPLQSDELINVRELKFEDVKMVESLLASEENMNGENILMELIWEISENIDVAIVGQHLLDMAYPDFVDDTKNDFETQRALYAKLTLRF